ncbi:hypothetical protein DM02DRAFT_660564 [Periconia macrospinosa]|uniref:Jacalin-type lectin domain-containing protein n=1 Tax=Periconia macrospinosa TaxID=97972 RepID=A0A2V1DA93_9PLEO|nr:hypothetical protein DM02DRAFT_660564 [Periconia macrospinosa]
MLFSIKSAALAATLLSTFGLSSARADTRLCERKPGDPVELTKEVGRPSPEEAFCDTKWNQGLTVTGVEVWATGAHVKAFQLTYSDNTKGPMHGNNLDTEGNGGNWYGAGKINFGGADQVTKLNLAKNYWGDGDRLGAVWMEVAGKKLEVKSDVGSYGGEPQPLSSGILIGAYGSAGADINSLGFMFLKGTIKKAEIITMEFPETLEDLNKQQKGIQTIGLDTADYMNSNPINGSSKVIIFQGTMSQSEGTSITVTDTHTFGVEMSISVSAEVKIPLFGAAKTELGFKTSYQYSKATGYGNQKTKTRTITYGEPKTSIPPQRGLKCRASVQAGEYSTEYKATVKLTLDDGSTFNVQKPGNFESVGFAKIWANCESVPIEEVKGSAREAGLVQRRRATRFNA